MPARVSSVRYNLQKAKLVFIVFGRTADGDPCINLVTTKKRVLCLIQSDTDAQLTV
jgi:hypothetical protein